MTDDQLWTARELAKFMGYSESTISRLVSQSPEKLPTWRPSVVKEWVKPGTAY